MTNFDSLMHVTLADGDGNQSKEDPTIAGLSGQATPMPGHETMQIGTRDKGPAEPSSASTLPAPPLLTAGLGRQIPAANWKLFSYGGAGKEILLDFLEAHRDHPGVTERINSVNVIDASAQDMQDPRLDARRPGSSVPLVLKEIQTTSAGAGQNPLFGAYFAFDSFAESARADSHLNEALQANIHVKSAQGGTGSALAPRHLRFLTQKRAPATLFLDVTVVEPVSRSMALMGERARDIWCLQETVKYADLMLLVENQHQYADMANNQINVLSAESLATTPPSVLRPDYLEQIQSRSRLPATVAAGDPRMPLVNDYIARILGLLVRSTRDAADIRSQIGPAINADDNTRLAWAIPCLYPLDSAGHSLDSEFVSIEFMVAAAMTHGAMASGTRPWTAQGAVVFVEVPETETVPAPLMIQEAVSKITGLDPSRVTVRQSIQSEDGAKQVGVLLIGAMCNYLERITDPNLEPPDANWFEMRSSEFQQQSKNFKPKFVENVQEEWRAFQELLASRHQLDQIRDVVDRQKTESLRLHMRRVAASG
jgi:hypothetical protein